LSNIKIFKSWSKSESSEIEIPNVWDLTFKIKIIEINNF